MKVTESKTQCYEFQDMKDFFTNLSEIAIVLDEANENKIDNVILTIGDNDEYVIYNIFCKHYYSPLCGNCTSFGFGGHVHSLYNEADTDIVTKEYVNSLPLLIADIVRYTYNLL